VEAFLKLVTDSGPAGMVAAGAIIVAITCYRAWRESEKALLTETKRSVEALTTTTRIIEEANESRAALTDSINSILKVNQEILGRSERILALVRDKAGVV
jgi:hypothetical protein